MRTISSRLALQIVALCICLFGVTMPAAAVVIDVEKFVNGADADAAPGLLVTIGDLVTFTYQVSSDELLPSGVPVSVTALIDDNGTPGTIVDDFSPTFLFGDTNSNGFVDPGEVWFYTSAGVIFHQAQAGLHGNVALVIGPLAVSDSDAAFYTGVSSIPVVPEPGTVVLLASGLAGLGLWRARHHRRLLRA